MPRLSLRRATILSLAAVGLLGSTGCFGSFQLTRKLHAFNKSVSDDKFVQELVFLAFAVPQIYSLVAGADALIFNTVEFWTGKNPVVSARTATPDGRSFVQTGSATAERKTLVIDEMRDGETLSTTTITNRIGDATVRVETRYKDGRSVSKTISRATDGTLILE